MNTNEFHQESTGTKNISDFAKTQNDNKSGCAATVMILLVISLLVWFIFFRSTAPKEVTTEMLGSGIVEAITQKEIIRQLEDANFHYYLDDIETIEVAVYMPNPISQNPAAQQTGSRYEVQDGYAYPVKMSLELHLTLYDIYGESFESNPIDIDVSGIIVYVTNVDTYAFRNVEIEYEEHFQSFLDLVELAAWWQ